MQQVKVSMDILAVGVGKLLCPRFKMNTKKVKCPICSHLTKDDENCSNCNDMIHRFNFNLNGYDPTIYQVKKYEKK